MSSTRSLVDTCLQIAIQNVQCIPSITGLPEMYALEILKSVKTAHHLKELARVDELTAEETAPHWQRLIQRDFPGLVRKYHWRPEQDSCWSSIYDKYKKADEKNKQSATEALMKAMNARKQESDNKNVRIVTMGEVKRILPRLPQDGRRGGAHWSESSGTSSKVPKSNLLGKARLEAKNASKTMRLPPAALRPVSRVLAKAPEAMIASKRIENQPQIRTTYRPPPNALESAEAERKRKELEARLLRIKAKSAPKATTADAGSPEESSSDSVGSPLGQLSVDEISAGAGALKRKRSTGLLSNSPGANSKTTYGQASAAKESPRVSGFVQGKPTSPKTKASLDDLPSPKRIKSSSGSQDFGSISPPNRKTSTAASEAKPSSAKDGRNPASSPSAGSPPASSPPAGALSPRTAARREAEAKLSPADRQRLAMIRSRKTNPAVMFKPKR